MSNVWSLLIPLLVSAFHFHTTPRGCTLATAAAACSPGWLVSPVSFALPLALRSVHLSRLLLSHVSFLEVSGNHLNEVDKGTRSEPECP